jgi:leucine-rich repeat protein SHOC2
MPNWMSYRGEGCSLSFHIPPVFQGLVLWFHKDDKDTYDKVIIRNNSNGRLLLKSTTWYYHPKTGCIRYIRRSKMAMEDYCGDDELELYIYSVSYDHLFKPPLYSQPRGDAVLNDHSYQPAPIKECGVHVIAGKSDSFEESEVGRDTVMPSPPLYHLLPHPHCGSITASTPKQWSDFLFAKLQGHNLSSTLWGKNTYFI